jgi:hypothetical protein
MAKLKSKKECQQFMCSNDAHDKREARKLALRLHPDKGGDTEQYKQYQDCYEREIYCNKARSPLKKIREVCDSLEKYTKADILDIADKHNLRVGCRTDKETMCKLLSAEVVADGIEDEIEELFETCKTSLERYKTQEFHDQLKHKVKDKLIVELVNQCMWLLEQHAAFNVLQHTRPTEPQEHQWVQQLQKFLESIKARCAQIDSIFMVYEPSSANSKGKYFWQNWF